MKQIVVFYSLDGNTKKAAETIAADLNADLLELKPVKSIPKKGFGKFFVGGYQAAFGICPPLKPYKFTAGSYDRIILGTPVWAGKCTPAIHTFLKENPVADKVAAVFASSGGGDNDNCLKKLNKNLHHLKCTAALADPANPAFAQNNAKIKAFVKELQSGK